MTNSKLYLFDGEQLNREMQSHERTRYEYQHILEKRRQERRELAKGVLLISVFLAALALLLVWPVSELK